METIRTVGLVVFKADKVLLVAKKNHPQQLLQLPGGQIEDDESAIQAGQRELTENTNLIAGQLRKIPGKWEAVIRKDYGEKRFTMTCFLVDEFSGEATGTNTAQTEWVSIDQLGKLPLNPNTEAAIRAALKLNKQYPT